MHRDFTGFGGEYKSFDAHKITDIQQLFPNGLIQGFVLTRTNIVLPDVELNSTFPILHHGEIGLAHIADAHDPSGQTHLSKLRFRFLRITSLDSGRVGVYGI